jgi:hypothetical protein
LFVALRLALPFFPSGPWSESGYHCGGYYLFLPLGKPHTCVAEKAFGEGARNANRLDFVSFRSEKFTVDERGYRNPPLATMNPRVILFGSSFSLGLALNDEDTIAAQLNRRLGPVVYNASKVLNPDLSVQPFVETARETGTKGGWALVEVINRVPYRYQPAEPQSRFADIMSRIAPLQSFQRRMKDPFALSRITAMINMRIDDDRVLPNPERWRYPEEELINGRHMLFYVDDRNFVLHPEPPRITVDGLVQLRDELQKHGMRLAVMLVPNGYTVYWPLLKDRAGDDRGKQYLTALEEGLAAAGIPAFNCLPSLREAAAGELKENQLVYWPDDAHWNPEGVTVAANGIAPWLGGLLSQH